jgi:hypothetical protein
MEGARQEGLESAASPSRQHPLLDSPGLDPLGEGKPAPLYTYWVKDIFVIFIQALRGTQEGLPPLQQA